MPDVADRPCAKCGASDANYRDNSTSGFFCYDCFALSIKQKFRFALSKTKLFSNSWNSNKEPVRVLVLVERNARAEALLQLIDTVANEPEEKRRFRLDTMVHIVDSSRTEKLLDEQTTIGNFTASNVHLSAVLNSNDGPVEKLKLYSEILTAMPTKSIECEFRRLMFDLLAWQLGTRLNFNIVLTTEHSDTIAQKSMTALWFGRSSSVSELAAPMDTRHPTVKILRPLRNLNNVELDFLINGGDFSASGDSLSSKFLVDVAENGFPAIVSTVLSVASKLDTNSAVKKLNNLSINSDVSHCPLCRKQSAEKLCEPCNRLISQIPSDKRTFVLNALCPVVE